MEIRIDKKIFVSVLADLKGILPTKPVMPILQNVLIEASGNEVLLTAYDSEIGMKISIPAEVQEEGAITLLGGKLLDIVKELPEEQVLLGTDEETCRAKIRSGKAFFDFAGLPADEYPMLPDLESTMISTLGASLSQVIGKVLYAKSSDSIKPALNGVFLQAVDQQGNLALRSVATDGHRLGLSHAQIDGLESLSPLEEGVVLPSKGALALRKLAGKEENLSFGFSQSGSELIVKNSNSVLVARLCAEKFPDYTRVLPKEFQREVHIDRISLLEAAKRVSALSDGAGKMVSCKFEDGQVKMALKSTLGDSEEDLSCDLDGEQIHLGLNYAYLIESLQSLEGETVTVQINDSLKPVVLISPEAAEANYALVQPMKL